ncbi:MAG TPA: beta-L-arabinofuranosidase domain-containing protein [Vicinamibacterales bacterium]
MMNRVFLAIVLAVSAGFVAHTTQQGGDQFLDGIGETGLVARYALAANPEDSSRNQFHASLKGTGGSFVEDPQFRTALLLTGDGSYVQLPGQALNGEDTLTVSGWLFLPTGASGPIFDFGQNEATRLYAVAARDGVRAGIDRAGAASATPVKSVLENQWIHFAVVLDPAAHTLTTYLDGAKAGQATDVSANAAQIINQSSAAANRLFFGRSQSDTAPTLHGRLRDVRIYRIALTDQQIATIRNNALSRRQTTGRRGAPPEISTAGIPDESPLAGELANVPDIKVETTVGTLPHLPYAIPATYKDKAKGPDVRVIWPSPTDNSQVGAPGTYTVTGKVPGTAFAPTATVIVKMAVRTATPPSRLAEAFPLSEVTLDRDTQGRETPFMKNRDKFIRGLAATNPDNFLYNFRDAFGQPQPAGVKQLDGWDNQTTRLRGHASGHYLTAIAQAYASTTYDEPLRANFLQKMNYFVDTLYELSRMSGKPAKEGGPSVSDPLAVPPGPNRKGYDSNLRAGAIRTDYWNWGTGFISAYPPDQFIMLEKGATYGTQDTQIWAPYYTLHKILAGLLDSYEVGGNKKALEIARGMGAWVYTRLKALPPETRASMWGRYIAGEYGGSNEVMARLYRLTGDRQFLECAKLFDNTGFFFGNANHDAGLAKNVDTIRGKHANQHIPQITGALETYRNTGEMPYWMIASNFWDIVNNSYMYSIGGVAGAKVPNNAECFTAEPNSLWQNGFASGGQNETCATYNLLKLDRQLFMYDQTSKYMDHYERAIYNHILASVAENDAGNTYHVPLNPGAQKRFGNADMSGFTCCNGTALESNTKLQDSIYFRSADNKALYVNLYIPSTLNWSERNLVVQQVTDFPYADTTKIVVKGSGPLDIKVRVPHWATRGFFVKVNGRDRQVKAVPGSYVSVGTTWRANDTIELRMPFSFYLDPVVDQPNVASIFWGPVLLAAEEAGPRTDWRKVTLDRTDISRSIKGDPATLHFTVDGVSLKPYYETYGRNSVYLNVARR